MSKYVERFTGFMGSCDTYQEATTVILGVPMDFTVSFRPGTRMGPQHIRTVSYGLEEYSVDQDKELTDYAYYDWGDINLPFGNTAESLKRIGQVTGQLLNDGKFPLLIGGEHLISFPIIEQVYRKYPDLAVLHFDAHADLRSEYLGEVLSHATVMRKVADLIGGQNLYQFGIRSGTREEFAYARENTNMYIKQVLVPVKEIIETIGKRPIYVSLDIDVLDPAFAPGTGTAEPGGCTSSEILDVIRLLGDLNIVGFDLVEVSPMFDQSERTGLLGAKIIREAIMSFTNPK